MNANLVVADRRHTSCDSLTLLLTTLGPPTRSDTNAQTTAVLIGAMALNAAGQSQPSSSRIPDETAHAFTSFIDGADDDPQKPMVEVTLPEVMTAPWRASEGHRKLVEAVKFLGPALTSEEEMRRLRAVVLLSLLVTTLAEDDNVRPRLFDKQAITTLAAFFASKIEDGNTVAGTIAQTHNPLTEPVPGSAPESRRKKFPPGSEMLVAALQALLALSKLDGFASEAAKVTADNLVRHASPRVHPQAIRFLAFSLMDSLLSRHRSALKSLGPEFVKGYIELVEGEKDPRNLVYIFAMDRVVLIEWDDLDSDTIESFFDTTYCYFPITFRPPPDDPYGISTNSLRIALRHVLTASPLLAPHALPLLIEKMQASGGNAKRDTLDTLAEALPVFGRSAALAHARELWQGFRIEIMHATDEATAICATRALDSLLFVLFVDVEEPVGLAPEIVADMLDELEEPSKQQSKAASTIMGAMVRATPGTAKLAIHAELDLLLSMYKETDDLSIRPSILDHLNTLIKAMREAYTPIEAREASREVELQSKEEGKFTFAKPSSNEAGEQGAAALQKKVAGPTRDYESDGRPMDKYRDMLISTIAHGLKTPTTRAPAVDAFVSLSHIGLLTVSELRHLCVNVNELLIDPSAEAVRGQALEGLRDLGNRTIVEEGTLPLLFNALPDRLQTQDETATEAVKGTIRRSLGALARLCDASDFFEMLVVRLSTKLDLLCAGNSQMSAVEEREANVGYARGLLNTLTFVLEKKVQRKDRDAARYAGMVPRLLGLALESALRDGDKTIPGVARDQRVLRDLGRLIMLLVQCLEAAKQQELAPALYAALFDGDLRPLARDSSLLTRLLEAQPSLRLRLFDDDVSSRQRDVLHAFASAIVALRRDLATAPPGDVNERLGQMITWTSNAASSLQEEGGSWLLADWINKHAKEPVAPELQAILDKFWAEEVRGSGQDDMDLDIAGGGAAQRLRRQRRAVRIWLVVSRGFLVKNSRQAEAMVTRILSLFDETESSVDVKVLHEAASGMGNLLREDHILCKDNGSVIRLLYRQRFVTFVLPKLLAGHKAANSNATRQSQEHANTAKMVHRNLHLVAICSLLPFLPRATLLERLTDLFPLLILALDVQEDGVVQASAASVINLAAAIGKRQRDEAIMDGRAATALGRAPKVSAESIMERNSLDLVCEHVTSVLRRLLRIVAAVDDDGDGQVIMAHQAPDATKVAALRCLATIARTVPYTTLHPHRTDVLRALGKRGQGIDDPKRIVRLEAVDSRDAWFRLKGEGEDEEDEAAAAA